MRLIVELSILAWYELVKLIICQLWVLLCRHQRLRISLWGESMLKKAFLHLVSNKCNRNIRQFLWVEVTQQKRKEKTLSEEYLIFNRILTLLSHLNISYHRIWTLFLRTKYVTIQQNPSSNTNDLFYGCLIFKLRWRENFLLKYLMTGFVGTLHQ